MGTPGDVSHRDATLGEEAHLRWALASLGAQLHRSRIDNRLVGRGSTACHSVPMASTSFVVTTGTPLTRLVLITLVRKLGL